MLVSGQSGCGKTFWVSKLIQQLREKFENITFAYTMYQDSYKNLNVTLVEGFPEDVLPNTLLILDDMMLDCDKNFAKYFTKMRHVNISTVFIVQNLYCCLMLVSIFTQRKILIPRQLLRKE